MRIRCRSASMTHTPAPFSLDRMVNAVEKVRQRLLRSSAALEAAQIPYAIAGGNAVALWVSRVDESAVRNTQDVDVLLRRADFERARHALEAAGFVHHRLGDLDLFLDEPGARARHGIHILYANEKVHAHESIANPDVTEAEATSEFRVLSLEALVRIKLTAYRDKDRVHLRDMIEVGLIDNSWLDRLTPELAGRLKSLLDTPGAEAIRKAASYLLPLQTRLITPSAG